MPLFAKRILIANVGLHVVCNPTFYNSKKLKNRHQGIPGRFFYAIRLMLENDFVLFKISVY